MNSVARSSWIQPWLLSSTSTSALSHSYDITARCFAHRLRCRSVSESSAVFLWLKGHFTVYFILTLFFVTPTISAPSLYFHPPCSSNFYIPLPLPSPHPNALTFFQILPLLISPFIPASVFIKCYAVPFFPLHRCFHFLSPTSHPALTIYFFFC